MLIPNKLNVTYSATLPNGKKVSENAESNTVTTEILTYSVTKTINTDKTTLKVGETSHSTVTVTNNCSAKMLGSFFIIPQPQGASYVKGSVKINGVAYPSYNPVKGFALPDLDSSQTIVIEYDLRADEPTPAPITHFATLKYAVKDPVRGSVNYSENTDSLALKVVSDEISVVKTVDKLYAVKGERLHYTVTITNTGNITKTDLIFRDPIPDGVTFVANSIKIDGINYAIYNPETGFVLRDLSPDEKLTVEFDVTVN